MSAQWALICINLRSSRNPPTDPQSQASANAQNVVHGSWPCKNTLEEEMSIQFWVAADSGHDRIDQRLDPDDVHDPCQIIGQDRERHFSGYFWKRFGQEVRRPTCGLSSCKLGLEGIVAKPRQQPQALRQRRETVERPFGRRDGTRSSAPSRWSDSRMPCAVWHRGQHCAGGLLTRHGELPMAPDAYPARPTPKGRTRTGKRHGTLFGPRRPEVGRNPTHRRGRTPLPRGD